MQIGIASNYDVCGLVNIVGNNILIITLEPLNVIAINTVSV